MKRTANRKIRHARIRAKIIGTAEVPRLSVFRSNKHIVAQLIDDTAGKTLIFASDAMGDAGSGKKRATKQKSKVSAETVGTMLAKKAVEKKITKVVFDRGGYSYHGRVRSLADGARKGGLIF